MRVLISGPTGFIGSALIARLINEGRFGLRGVVRHESAELSDGVEHVVIGDLESEHKWQPALAGVHTVVQLAARVHVMREEATIPLAEFRRVNVVGTLNVARWAAAAGVKRFVFLSSVKVNGEGGPAIYREADSPAPQDAYGISKHEAELGLRQIATETGMEVVIVRPPLVYGPGVKANFQALLRAISRGIPLPLGAIDNRRSLVAVTNIVDLIVTCIEHPAAANETFLVSDGEDLSTPDLIRRLASAMGRTAYLFPVPPALLMAGATLLGKRELLVRLCGSLQVDITKVRKMLGWTPPMSVEEGLRRTVEHYLQQP